MDREEALEKVGGDTALRNSTILREVDAGMTLSEVAARWGITAERVRVIVLAQRGREDKSHWRNATGAIEIRRHLHTRTAGRARAEGRSMPEWLERALLAALEQPPQAKLDDPGVHEKYAAAFANLGSVHAVAKHLRISYQAATDWRERHGPLHGATLPPESLTARVEQAVRDGARTADEVAAVVGGSVEQAMGSLRYLGKLKRVRRIGVGRYAPPPSSGGAEEGSSVT